MVGKEAKAKSIPRKSKCVVILSRLNYSLLEGEGHLIRLRKLSQVVVMHVYK